MSKPLTPEMRTFLNWELGVKFRVIGTPITAGSKRHVGRGIIVDSSGTKGREWRALVQDRARGEILDGSMPVFDAGPVEIEVVFVLARPKHHFRANGELKDHAPKFHDKRPDATKLLRAIEDALTGIMWRDDAQIAKQVVTKGYGKTPGAWVSVRRLP